MTAEDWKDIGLAIAGCIPIVGSVVAVGEALSEAYDGNYVDAGISLAGVIPFAGIVGKVAKFAKKGKIAGKIAKALNAGKKLKKGFKGKKTRLPFGKMKTKGKRVQANTGKAIKDAAGKIAGKMRKLTPEEKYKYRRPTKFRNGVREKAWNAAKDSKGKVKDPLTKKVMDKNEPWDMGHKPGYEFRKHQQSAAERGISRKQFLDEHNESKHYRPEMPKSNRGHKLEDDTDNYLGP